VAAVSKKKASVKGRKPAAKKATPKKAASKKTALKKKTVKKAASKKPAPKKPLKKAAPKKVINKSAVKKPVKKLATKKPTPKKAAKKVAKKVAPKKVVKKSAAKKPTPKKAAKKAAPKKVVKKSAAKKPTPKKAAKKVTPKKVVKKSAAKKPTPKKAAKKVAPKKVVKKSTAKMPTPKKVAKKIALKKVVVKKTAAPKKIIKKSAVEKPVKKPTPKKAVPKKVATKKAATEVENKARAVEVVVKPPPAKPPVRKRRKSKKALEREQELQDYRRNAPAEIPHQYRGRAKQPGPFCQPGIQSSRLAPIGPSLMLAPKEEVPEESAFARQASTLPKMMANELGVANAELKKKHEKKVKKPVLKRVKFPENKWYVLVGLKLGHLWVGRKVHAVDAGKGPIQFDWRLVLTEEERCGGIVGFWVPRDKDQDVLSEQDRKTVQGWSACFGKSLVLVLAGKKSQVLHVFDKKGGEGRAISVVTDKTEEFVIAIDKP